MKNFYVSMVLSCSALVAMQPYPLMLGGQAAHTITPAIPLLYAAILKSDCAGIDEQLRRGADIDMKAPEVNGVTPLAYAIENNAPLSIIEHLIESGANVNEPCVLGKRPLHFAVSAKRYEVTHLLCRYHANIVYSDKKRLKPIDYAAVAGDMQHLLYFKDLYGDGWRIEGRDFLVENLRKKVIDHTAAFNMNLDLLHLSIVCFGISNHSQSYKSECKKALRHIVSYQKIISILQDS